MTELPLPRQEYTLEEAVLSGQAPLFIEFELAFRKYLQEKIAKWPIVEKALQDRPWAGILEEIQNNHIPLIADAPNFNQYKGDLERACAAAKHLSYRYDLGIGIAKKGLWTSFIFHLFGLPTRDCLAIRLGKYGESVFTVPLDPLHTKDISGKRVLLFDNDAVTGRSVKTISDQLKLAHPKNIDLLLIYGHTEITKEFYETARKRFIHSPTIYGERNGNIVLDCRSEVLPYVNKVISIDEYPCLNEKIEPLWRILKVKKP